jgi:ribose/xylose/arabinose/galactoside ABC-type transport system permease subunit
LSAALAYAALVIVVGIVTPSFLGAGNVRDLAMNNAAVLLVAIGITTVIVSGEIDI